MQSAMDAGRARTSSDISVMPARQRYLVHGSLYGLLILGALVVLLPYILMVSTSLKPESDLFQVGIWKAIVPSHVRWANYAEAWNDYPLGRWLFNSFLVATIEMICTVVTSVFAGYAFARLRFWGRDVIFFMYLGAMMVPLQVTLIPSFIIVRNLGLLNTYEGIIVLRVVQWFGVFLMRQFFLGIPRELEDAARIDGCNYLQVLLRIILPISRPAIGVVAIFGFTAGWNDFLWPLVVVNKPEIMTIVLGLAGMHGDITPWGQLMAATMISAIPLMVIYICFQRLFTQGIVTTGFKG